MFFVREAIPFPNVLDRALSGALLDDGSTSAASLGKILGRLWPILAKQRGRADTTHYSFDAEMARAYAAYYLPANLMKVSLVLEEMKRLGLKPGTSLRWLDFGSGPGTALWGLASWAKQNAVEFEFWGLEQSAHFLGLAAKLGRELLGALYDVGTTRPQVHWESFRHTGGTGNAGGRQRQGPLSLVQWVRTAKPNVVSFVNSIDELVPDLAARKEMLLSVVEELRLISGETGKPCYLILIEPGTFQASREVVAVRDALMAQKELRVCLPCLSHRPCGALQREGDWCHEAAAVEFPKWMDELGTAAGLRKEAVLFSYLVCMIGASPFPAGWPEKGSRVVSQMMHEKGLDQCFLCTESGKKKARLLHSRKTAVTEGFTSWGRGEILETCELSEKGDVTAFTGFPRLR